MKKIIPYFLLFFFLGPFPCHAGFLDGFFRGSSVFPKMRHGLDPTTAGAGIRDALAVDSQNAVALLSKKNGYLSNNEERRI